MENEVPLSQVFTLFLIVRNHFWGYGRAAYALDNIFKYEPKHHLVFMDAFDVCDLVYTKNMMVRDHHYDIVRQLWLEFFAVSQMEEIPFKTQAVIAPPAAYEVVQFAFDHIMPMGDGWAPKRKTMDIRKWNAVFNEGWRRYLNIERFLDKKSLGKYVEKIVNLYKDEKLVEFSKVIEGKTIFSEAKTMNDIKEQVHHEINYKEGMRSLRKRRPPRALLNNEIDMRNLVTCVAYRKSLSNQYENLVFITSHSGQTLGGWSDSWNLDIFDSPIKASLSENILVTTLVRKKGNVREARDFTVNGRRLSRDIMESLQRIPEIEKYMQESDRDKRRQREDEYRKKKVKVKISSRILFKIDEWRKEFARTKTPEILPSGERERKIDHKIVTRLLKDETYRKKLVEEASFNAKKMFSLLEQLGILKLDTVFVPEDPKCMEVLNWLRASE